MSDYVDVKTRLVAALEKYPQLRITEHRPTWLEIGGQIFIECGVTVARDPEDPVPVTAYMYEPFPGRTPYTKMSEQANGATSALGRALGYMGFGITASIASANEVRNRQESPTRVDQIEERRAAKPAGKATSGQVALIMKMSEERGIQTEAATVEALSFDAAKEMINHLKTVARPKPAWATADEDPF
jgi:hypothetical protein